MSSLDTTITTTITTTNFPSHPSSPSHRPDPSTTCLFCHHPSPSLEANLTHMFRAHGFLIPHLDRLLVDLETFLAYLQSIIEDDAQCIHCFTQRASGEAVRQHMLGKPGHCGIEVGEGDELGEFYGSEEDEEGEEGEDQDGDSDSSLQSDGKGVESFVRLDDGSVRLASGRIVSNRNATRSRPGHRYQRQTTPPSTKSNLEDGPTSTPSPSSSPQRLTATSLSHPLPNQTPLQSRHELALSHMRHSDRTALTHLPQAQQRALLATQRQQASSADRAQQAMKASVGQKGNKTLMKYFKPKVPKRKNGLHRESLKA